MLRQIVLHGKLKELYKDDIYFDVSTVSEALRACCYQVPGFTEEFRVGYYRVSLEEDSPDADIDESLLGFKLGKTTNKIHLIPVMEGAKGGVGKIVMGLALIGLSFAIPGAGIGIGLGGIQTTGIVWAGSGSFFLAASTVAKFGLALVLGGVSSLLSPKPDAGPGDQSTKPSFLFAGPQNLIDQGGPVPLIYGEVIAGSTVVSVGLSVENI